MLYVSKERGSTFLIDRKFLIKQVRHPVYVELWGQGGDTLLDGELVLPECAAPPGQPQATFMVFDVLVLNGQRTLERKLSERLAQIGSGIVAVYRRRFPPAPPAGAGGTGATFASMQAAAIAAPPASPSGSGVDTASSHPVAVRAKAFHRKHHLKDGIFDHIRQVGKDDYEYDDGKRKNKNDGVIFTPEDDSYWCKNVPLLKWSVKESKAAVGAGRKYQKRQAFGSNLRPLSSDLSVYLASVWMRSCACSLAPGNGTASIRSTF